MSNEWETPLASSHPTVERILFLDHLHNKTETSGNVKTQFNSINKMKIS